MTWSAEALPDRSVRRGDKETVALALLADRIKREYNRSVIATAVGGSSVRDGQGDPHDIDVIAVADSGPRRRLRLQDGLFDIFLESRESIEAELDRPRRAAVICLLVESVILFDDSGLLEAARQRASELIRHPAPASLFRSEFSLVESVRDTVKRYCASSSLERTFLRAVLITQLTSLACYRLRLWSSQAHKVLRSIDDADAEIGELFRCTLLGDEPALADLCDLLLSGARKSDPNRCGKPALRRAMVGKLQARWPADDN